MVLLLPFPTLESVRIVTLSSFWRSRTCLVTICILANQFKPCRRVRFRVWCFTVNDIAVRGTSETFPAASKHIFYFILDRSIGNQNIFTLFHQLQIVLSSFLREFWADFSTYAKTSGRLVLKAIFKHDTTFAETHSCTSTELTLFQNHPFKNHRNS